MLNFTSSPTDSILASTVATKLNSTSEIEYLSLKGEIVEGEFAELILDDKSVLETMLQVFYTPADAE